MLLDYGLTFGDKKIINQTIIIFNRTFGAANNVRVASTNRGYALFAHTITPLANRPSGARRVILQKPLCACFYPQAHPYVNQALQMAPGNLR